MTIVLYANKSVTTKGHMSSTHVWVLPHLDVAGLLHEPASVLCSSVAFRQLDSEELESPFEVCLQEVLFRCLEGDMKRRR